MRTILFDAVAAGDTREVDTLVSQHSKRIAVLFPTWTTVPADVRSDSLRTKWWAEDAIGVAQAAARLGDSSLMLRLIGPIEDNIILLWQDAFVSAHAEASNGKYASAIRILERIVERTEELTGSGVDDFLPKTCGLLGTLYYSAGNATMARTYTLKAKEYCERIGDREGVKMYTIHLLTIDAT